MPQRAGSCLREIPHGLSHDPAEEAKAFATVLECYDMRSEILHGRWDNNPQIDLRMGETEAVVRRVFLRIMNEPNMLATFLSPGRNSFLENLP